LGPGGLGPGYACRTGHQAVRSERDSCVPHAAYDGGHVSPVVTLHRREPVTVVPAQAIRPAEVQLLRADA